MKYYKELLKDGYTFVPVYNIPDLQNLCEINGIEIFCECNTGKSYKYCIK